MIAQKNYTIRVLLLNCLCLSLNFGFAQCGPLSIDSINNPGEYTTASILEANGIRNGPDYDGATIYYPTNALPPFASITIVPGFTASQSSIEDWGPFLASHGIVTMIIGTNSGFDQPEERRDALLDAVISLKEENTRSGSPLLGKLDVNSIAVGGWSMGGGGAQLAASADPSIKAVMALCPWLGPTTTAADLNHAAPVLIFSAEFDVVAPHAAHADLHYGYTPMSTTKMLFEIESGNHSSANDPTGGGNYVGKIALAWLKYYLIGNSCYCPLVLDTPPTASDYLLNVDCSAVLAIDNITPEDNRMYQLYPNPTSGNLTIEVAHPINETNYQIYSSAGVLVGNGEISNQSTLISIQDLSPGVYIFSLNTFEATAQSRFVVH